MKLKNFTLLPETTGMSREELSPEVSVDSEAVENGIHPLAVCITLSQNNLRREQTRWSEGPINVADNVYLIISSVRIPAI